MGERTGNPGSDRKWWYCLRHNAVEFGPGCADRLRLGPFGSEEEAAFALERAEARNEAWDEADEAERQ